MKVHLIQIPIYFGFLRIVITNNFNKAAMKLNVNSEGNDLNTFGSFVSVTGTDLGNEYFNLFLNKDIDHDLIAHEVVHLVNTIFSKRRIKLDSDNDEPQAYFAGWITKQIYLKLNK